MPRPRRGADGTLEYLLRAYIGPRRDVRPAGSVIPVAVNPVRPSPPLPHHIGHCGDIPDVRGQDIATTATVPRTSPVSGALESAHCGGQSTNRYTAALEAAPVRAQDAPRCLNRSGIRQDGRQLPSTARHTSTRRETVQHACKLLPPWPIKGGAVPQPRGDGTTDNDHSHALRLLGGYPKNSDDSPNTRESSYHDQTQS
jgi:hypothetical protein